MKDFLDCGCGGKKVDDAEIERVLREIEEEREKVLVPVPVRREEAIPVRRDDVFSPTRKGAEVER